MIATIELSEAERATVLRDATAQMADNLLANAVLTRQQAAHMLRISLPTLNLLPIRRLKIGGSTRYRMADLKAHIDSVSER